jgi:hypothetical protein
VSDRKQRQLKRLSPEDRVLTDVRTLCESHGVASVEGHMAGYFNELGITVSLLPTATDGEVSALRLALLNYFAQSSSSSAPGFTWMVMFSRGAEQLDPLIPGDPKRGGPE